jgi:hypothetical protein
MTLSELIIAVNEKNLSKEQLEAYADQITNLYATMLLETAELEKEEALFMANADKDESVAKGKVMWKATPSGQSLIVLKRYLVATKELINSLKSRTFRLIY